MSAVAVQELVTACVFVAAKVEEVSVSTNHLINAALLLDSPAQAATLAALAPAPALVFGDRQPPLSECDDAVQQQQNQQEQQQEQQQQQQQEQQQQQQQPERADQQQQIEVQEQQTKQQQQQQQQTELQQQQQTGLQQQKQQLLPEQPELPDAAEQLVAVGDEYYAAKDR
jgi:uncharacterized protein HemX